MRSDRLRLWCRFFESEPLSQHSLARGGLHPGDVGAARHGGHAAPSRRRLRRGATTGHKANIATRVTPSSSRMYTALLVYESA